MISRKPASCPRLKSNQDVASVTWRKIFWEACKLPIMYIKSNFAQMINCLHGGPKFLICSTPISTLNSDFLVMGLQRNIEAFESANGRLIALFYDGNRTNRFTCKNSLRKATTQQTGENIHKLGFAFRIFYLLQKLFTINSWSMIWLTFNRLCKSRYIQS